MAALKADSSSSRHDMCVVLSRQTRIVAGRGTPDKADALLEEASLIAKHADPQCFEELHQTLSLLGTVYKQHSMPEQLEKTYRRIHECFLAAGQQDSLAVARNLSELCKLYTSQSRFAEAEPALKRSIALYSKYLGLKHEEARPLLKQLADVYVHLERLDDAQVVSTNSLELAVQVDDIKSVEDVSNQVREIARLFRMQGKLQQSAMTYKRCLELLTRCDRMKKERLPEILHELAFLYEQMHEVEELSDVYERILEANEVAYGSNDSRLLPDIVRFAQLCIGEKQFAKAETLLKKAMELNQASLDDEDVLLEQIDLYKLLGELYRGQMRYMEAQITYQEAQDLAEKERWNHPY